MPLRVPLGVWVMGFHTKLSPSKDLLWVLPPLSGGEEMVEMGLSVESNDSNRPAGLWEEELFAIVDCPLPGGGRQWLQGVSAGMVLHARLVSNGEPQRQPFE